MKLSWIKSDPPVRRPIKDIEELLGDTYSEDRGGVMGNDVETIVSVDRILAARDKYKKQAASK